MKSPAVVGRRSIAQALSGVKGVPVSVYQIDKLAARKYHPLPIHGRGKAQFAWLDELQTWWEEEDST